MPARRHAAVCRLAAALAIIAPLHVQAINRCELDGQPINLNNGNETKGRSGLIRCRDDKGALQREQQLQNGVTMGLARFYRDGVLEQEFGTNERGNRDGRSRTYAATPGATNPLLREETLRNGSTVGIARSWYPDGTLKRLGFHTDDGRETAVAEFTPQGRLADLRCTSRPVFAPDADDANWCGFRKGMTAVELFANNGAVRARVTFDHGERRQLETLWEDGTLREQTETGATQGVERRFAKDGVKRKETAWTVRTEAGRAQRIVTLEQEFHESGTLVHERRWVPSERGADLALEQHWYLNGQLRDKTEVLPEVGQRADARRGQRLLRETTYHDNGRVASEGLSLADGDAREQPVGVHKRFDGDGRLRAESHYDTRGRLTRQRELDADGTVVQDDQVFEDGSRKAFAK